MPTSRPVGYDGQLGDVVDREVRMAEFNPADIRKFIGNWDFRPPKSQERLVQAISARRPIQEICRNPLMLTIVTSLYKETEYQLPDSREAFYRTCIDALLRKWDAVRLLEERNKINPDQKEAFLQEFAFEALKEGTLDFHDTALLAKIEAFLERRKYTGVDAGRFKFELMRSGLLADLPTGELFFAHKTLAESLAAFHLRGKSDTLNELWARKPDVWLEVCSLVVADPRTDEKDIAGLLRTAQVAQNWTGLLTLAGEAHLCPPPQRKEIVEELLLRQALWPGYDQRAVSGIARLGADTHAIFGEMMGHGDLQVRIRAIYALGLLLHENWASEMIVSSLRDRSTRTAAISAIAGMAEDAIPVVRRLLHTQPHYEVALACIHTLKAVSGLPAVETLLPLLAHEEEPVRSEAAFAAGQILADPDMRTAFEGSSAPGVPAIPDTEIRETMYWAVPWVDEGKTAHRTMYGLIIQQLAQTLRNADISSLEQAVTVGARFLIPALIKVGPSARAKIVENIQGIDEESFKIQRPVPERVLRLCSEIKRLSKPENIWMRARDVHQEDIALKGERAVLTLGALFSVIVIAPILMATSANVLSPWWLSVEAAVLTFATFAAIGEDLKTSAFVLALMHGYSAVLLRLVVVDISSLRGSHDALGICAAFVATAIMGISIYSVYALGGWWWICTFPFVLTIGCEIHDDKLTIWRRSNPLATVRDKLESEQRRTGWENILSNR